MATGIMTSEVMTVTLLPQKVVGIRHKGSYSDIPRLFEKLYKHITSLKDATPSGPPLFLFHERDEETARKANKEGTADIELCAPIKGDAQDAGEFKVYRLPGGKMAQLLHKGPYEKTKASYDRLFAWIKKEGKKITGPIREVYLNSPDEVRQDELLTEIYAPIG